MPVVRFRDFGEKPRYGILSLDKSIEKFQVSLMKRHCDSVLSSQVILNLRPLLDIDLPEKPRSLSFRKYL